MTKEIVFDGDVGLDVETPVYRYLPLESFFHLFRNRTLWFQRISSWPDAFEGARFEFFKTIRTDDAHARCHINSFLGSSWTLQTENWAVYSDDEDCQSAEAELKDSGSAAMWESYCKNGGVRIKSTIGKIESLLDEHAEGYECYRGRIAYESSRHWKKSIKTQTLISKLFLKRVPFRYESEYRFVLVASGFDEAPRRAFYPLGDVFEFVDEFLISPAVKDREWISRMLYEYATSISISPHRAGTNFKNGQKYCRISNLYGNISEEL